MRKTKKAGKSDVSSGKLARALKTVFADVGPLIKTVTGTPVTVPFRYQVVGFQTVTGAAQRGDGQRTLVVSAPTGYAAVSVALADFRFMKGILFGPVPPGEPGLSGLGISFSIGAANPDSIAVNYNMSYDALAGNDFQVLGFFRFLVTFYG
jgi:hypothetical protein